MNAADRITIGLAIFVGGVIGAWQGWPLAGALIGTGIGTALGALWRARKDRGGAPVIGRLHNLTHSHTIAAKDSVAEIVLCYGPMCRRMDAHVTAGCGCCWHLRGVNVADLSRLMACESATELHAAVLVAATR